MPANIETGIPFFTNVVQRPQTTSAGPCDLPILYSDASLTSLPVTTANARAAGFELWGFPKYQTGIETSFQNDRVRIVLEREFEISMKRGFHVTTSGLPLCLFSLNRDDEVVRTVVETESKIEWGGAQSVSVTMQGDGPTASKMRALGLDSQKPTLAFVTDHMKAILPLGENMGALAMEIAAAAQ